MSQPVVTATKNPIIPRRGVCDPHMHLFGDRVYLFAGHDADPSATDYSTHDWLVWSSDDLVTWRQDATIDPANFFTGPIDCAWACDAAAANGRYYFYFSHGNFSTGVAVADRPEGPYTDALGRPLLDGTLTPTREYDPAVFIDDDSAAYIVFGGPAWAYGEGAGYFIARLNDDMISLAEQPRRLELDQEGDDKASLNKIGGRYYLTHGSNYAISDDVYGPYRFMGNTGASGDHGSYFEWNGQLFNAFTVFERSMNYRATGICYVHQSPDGQLSVDPVIVEYGVGHYDARWNKIEAEWFMAATGIHKAVNPLHGFDVVCDDTAQLVYPHVHDTDGVTGISFFATCSSPEGGRITVYDSADRTDPIAVCDIAGGRETSWGSYRMAPTPLLRALREDATLYLALETSGGELRVDFFTFF